MNEMLKLIEERHSARVPFDRERPIAKGELRQIEEGWYPGHHGPAVMAGPCPAGGGCACE